MNHDLTTNSFSEDINQYSINTAEIWMYERSIVFSENCNDELASNLIHKLRDLIVLKGEPDFNFDENGNESFKSYFSRKMNIYLDSVLSFKKLFQIEYFFDKKENCYSFCTPIYISKTDSNFDFWFTLFLRRYHENIFEIYCFLDFQLLSNFNNNKTDFFTFLNLCLRQYNDLLSTQVVQTSQDWMTEKANENTIKARRSNKGVESNFIPNHAFKLKGVNDFSEYFVNKAYDFSEIMKELKKDFFHESTRVQQLKDILSGIEIDPKNRIEWKGSYYELNIFVSILNYDLKKINPIKNGLWETTCNCFTKNGKQIEVNQLSKAKGVKNKKDKLMAILEKL